MPVDFADTGDTAPDITLDAPPTKPTKGGGTWYINPGKGRVHVGDGRMVESGSKIQIKGRLPAALRDYLEKLGA